MNLSDLKCDDNNNNNNNNNNNILSILFFPFQSFVIKVFYFILF